MRSRVVILALGLGAVLGAWWWSRTRTGAAAVADVADFIGDVVSGPRGIRNNNPGNIDWIQSPAKRWRGMYRQETEEEGGRFGVFDTPANGVRAIAKELELDARRGLRTVALLIGGDPSIAGSGWAPSSENDTAAYVRRVSRELGVGADEAIDVRSYLPRLVAAIIRVENAVQPYSADELHEWVYAA